MRAGTIVNRVLWSMFWCRDTPANGAFSIRHSTWNFPNREGSKLQSGQIASVALMDARSIAATAANKGVPYTGNSYGCGIHRTDLSFR